MTALRVSVIVPVLNEGDAAQASLRSAETAGADEIIVVDGGSRDNTRECCSAFCDRLIQTEPGRAIQQNRGAESASGDIFLFLHADCTLPADGVDAIRTALGRNPDAVGGCFEQHIDADSLVYRIIEKGNAARVRMLGWAYGDQGIFIRRRTFEDLGGFPSISLMEDLYLMKRARKCGRLLVIPQRLTVSARRWQQQGVLRRTLGNWTLIAKVHLGVSPERLKKSYQDVR